jgi:hypothetical protein
MRTGEIIGRITRMHHAEIIKTAYTPIDRKKGHKNMRCTTVSTGEQWIY